MVHGKRSGNHVQKAKIVWALPETALLLLEWILYVFQALFYIFPLHLSCGKSIFIWLAL